MALFFDGINEACDVDDYQLLLRMPSRNDRHRARQHLFARGLRRVAAMLRPAQSGDAAEPGADDVCENRAGTSAAARGARAHSRRAGSPL